MIGKRIGKDRIYIHISAISMLPHHIVYRAYDAILATFTHIMDEANFIITHPNHIDIVEAENFDTSFEPVLGKRYRVDNDGNVIVIPRPNKPRVLHQRYKTVAPYYTGFDQDADREREAWYRGHFDAKRMAGAGYEHIWLKMLKEIEEKA